MAQCSLKFIKYFYFNTIINKCYFLNEYMLYTNKDIYIYKIKWKLTFYQLSKSKLHILSYYMINIVGFSLFYYFNNFLLYSAFLNSNPSETQYRDTFLITKIQTLYNLAKIKA